MTRNLRCRMRHAVTTMGTSAAALPAATRVAVCGMRPLPRSGPPASRGLLLPPRCGVRDVGSFHLGRNFPVVSARLPLPPRRFAPVWPQSWMRSPICTQLDGAPKLGRTKTPGRWLAALERPEQPDFSACKSSFSSNQWAFGCRCPALQGYSEHAPAKSSSPPFAYSRWEFSYAPRISGGRPSEMSDLTRSSLPSAMACS